MEVSCDKAVQHLTMAMSCESLFIEGFFFLSHPTPSKATNQPNLFFSGSRAKLMPKRIFWQGPGQGGRAVSWCFAAGLLRVWRWCGLLVCVRLYLHAPGGRTQSTKIGQVERISKIAQKANKAAK